MAGSLGYAACLYWTFVPVHFFGGLPWWGAFSCPLLVGLYLGLYPSIFALAIYWGKDYLNWFWLGVFSGTAWSCLEYLRGVLFSGLPWLNLAQAFAVWPRVIQVLELIGASGTAGAIAAIGTWIALGVSREKKSFIATCFLVLIILVYGAMEFNTATQKQSRLKVALVQGNIKQEKKWDPEFQNATVKKYLRLSQKLLRKHNPDLLIWPETAMPFYIQKISPLSRKIFNFAEKNHIYLLTGSPGFKFSDKKSYQLFNRAYLINPGGEITQHYGKEHLVPFGEYVPARKLLPFLDTLVIGNKDFSSGIQTQPLRIRDLDLGILICYEIIFSGLVQKRVNQGANLLVNISNDAWFGNTAAPRQHLNQAVIRAIEQNRYLLRSTNTGISAFITPKGEVLKKSTLMKSQSLFSRRIFKIERQSFFSRHNFRLHLLYFVITVLLFLIPAIKNLRVYKQ